MATTQNTYTGNGTNKLFSITFPYLDTSDIDVYINGVLQTITTQYSFANATTIEFVTAPANGATVLLDRSTDDTNLQATFFPGSSIKAADLNYNFDQILYLSQETANIAQNQSTAGLQAQITAANNTSNTALTTANTANSTANTANTTANGIAGTANTALTNANSAVATANAAVVTANGASVTANSALATVSGLNGVNLNRIINGDMRIDQRNAGAAVNNAADGTFAVDRWVRYQNVGASNVGRNLNGVTPPAGFTNYLGIQISTAGTATSSQYTNFQHYVEGFNSADLAWGTANAQAATISFWVRSSLTGTQGFALQNASSALGYPFTVTINVANTWEYKTVTIPGPTTGTWDTTNGRGIALIVDLGMGSSFRFTAGSWQSANVQGVTGANSLNQTINATFYITGVQLEPGSAATPFERRSYGQELALCQRYAYVNQQGDTGRAETTAKTNNSVKFPVTMRTAPSAAVLGTLKYRDNSGTTTRTASSPSAPVVSPSTPDGAYYELTASSWSPSNFTIGNLTHICCDAGANGILFTAEL